MTSEIRDTLPQDLDISAVGSDYVFPNNSRRRTVGALYIFIGVVFSAVWLVLLGRDTALVNVGFLAAGIALILLGLHHIAVGKDLLVDDKQALLSASDAVEFSVGHASAQLGWRGWASRPTWKVLLFSNEPQPKYRALVRLDGINGKVVDMLSQDNPDSELFDV